MLLYDSIIVRGLMIDAPESVTRYKLFVKAYPGNDSLTFEIPNNTILNQGQVKQAVREHFDINNLKVTFPRYLIKRLIEE